MLGVHLMEFSVAGFHTHQNQIKMAVFLISDLVELYSMWWLFLDLKRAIFGLFKNFLNKKWYFSGNSYFLTPSGTIVKNAEKMLVSS